jgi:dinuclear metal center YbgI/SA1388 family protein
MKSQELTAYLNEYLCVPEIPDYKEAYNGLQVEGSADINRIALAVDACHATIEQAAESGAQMLIVHHGLFWGAKAPITGMYYRRVSALIKHDLALYSCHLPLDAHPEVGNNHVLMRMLGLSPDGLFGEFEGVPLGVTARTDMSREEFVRRVWEALHVAPHVIATGPENVRKVGVLTGAGGSLIGRAAKEGIDTYLTGEGAHHTYFDAEEHGLNVLYAGHYATETVGVQALGKHLTERFGLKTFFIDHPTGL